MVSAPSGFVSEQGARRTAPERMFDTRGRAPQQRRHEAEYGGAGIIPTIS